MIKKIKIIVPLLLMISIYNIFSQNPSGRFVDKVLLPNLDTLKLNRTYSEWWYGITGGVNLNTYYSQLQVPYNPGRVVDQSNKLFDYPKGLGAGLFAGLRGEWLPFGSSWGVMIDLYLWDYRHAIAQTDIITDTMYIINPEREKFRFQTKNNFTYLTLSPSVRFSLPIEHLYLFGGFDFELIIAQNAEKITKYEHTGSIDQVFNLNYNEVKSRVGFHIGSGYDIFLADFQHKWRIFFCPFISFNAGTVVLSDFGSSWNTFMLRVGFTVKLERDYIEEEILYYNPEYTPGPVFADAITIEDRIEFPGFEFNPLPANQLAYIEKPQIIVEISEKLQITPKKVEEPKVAKTDLIDPKKVEIFNYETTSDVTLDQKAMNYLDKLAEFLKANPNFEVRIVGHSDNVGTYEQNLRRSNLRVQNVINYLVKKGIPRSRMLARARGAVEPIASNTTDAGRRLNRRVEISIIEK